MALIRTDYGLIYNTDGSLCATLLPEGGVAVTEGTTNLCVPAYKYTNTWTTIDYGWDRRTYLDCTAGDVFTISADIRNLSQGEDRRWAQVIFRDSGGIELKYHNATGRGMSEQRLSFTTPPAPVGTVEARVYWVNNAQGSNPYQGKNFQIEKKPYSTPFTEGTRPTGRLPYDIPQLKGARDFTLHFKFLPYMFEEINWRQYLFSTRTDNYLHYYASINNSGTQLAINTALEEDNTWVYAYIDNPPININSWHRYVMTGRQEGDQATLSIYLDGVEVYTSTRVGTLRPFPGILALGTNHSLSSAFNGAFRELYICPYAVSAETVATWHSLDAPFYDPREQIDAGARTIYAPGTTIGAKGLVVDKSGVDQVAVGDISGREWKGSPLPSGTFGLWAPDGFIAVSENESIIVADAAGLHTTSTSWQDIPGFTVTITVKDSAAIFVTARFNARVRTTTNANVVGYFRLLRNGVQLDLATIGINTGSEDIVLRTPVMCSYLDKQNTGTYQYKCQFRSINDGVEVSSFDRELIVNVMKR